MAMTMHNALAEEYVVNHLFFLGCIFLSVSQSADVIRGHEIAEC